MKLLWKIKYNFLKKLVMSTSNKKFLDWPETMQIISSKKNWGWSRFSNGVSDC